MELNLNMQHYLKQNFHKLGYKVQVHSDRIVSGSKEYKIEQKNVYPIFTHEKLEAMDLFDLYELASSIFRFNKDRFYPTSYVGLMVYFGWDEDNSPERNEIALNKMRHVLRRHVYCSEDNHRPQIVMATSEGKKNIGELILLAKELGELGLSKMGCKTLDKLFT